MLITLTLVAIAFYWLGIETDWLRVRLLVGAEPIKETSCPYPFGIWLKQFKHDGIKLSSFIPAPVAPFSPVKHIGYSIIQSANRKGMAPFPEIYTIPMSLNTEPIVSREWLDKHWADLEDYQPELDLVIGGNRYHMVVRQAGTLDKVMHVNKLSRQEKKRYALSST